MGSLDYGTDADRVERIAIQIHEVSGRGVEMALVVGAGNIYRGLQGAARGMDRATADYMGMLATVLNALTLQDALEKRGPTPGCCRRSRSPRLRSPTSAAGRSVTSRRGGS